VASRSLVFRRRNRADRRVAIVLTTTSGADWRIIITAGWLATLAGVSRLFSRQA